jgi:2-succinyl-5-enolpyruvyl-6-hydroxy-3-cyclohexene-1-carboxylate synthase
MNRYQPIYDIAEVCARKGVHYAVLCPGSRCAPLTLSFVRHPDIHQKTFSDERSAAFIALGISQQTKSPAILVCTSGSAAYNFAPGVAEAFFSQTPLLVFTADRPAEWIAQHDGQTIHQPGIFGKHVKKSFELPEEYDHPDSLWSINRIINEAINLSLQEPAGPVHINAPFREPLYPKSDYEIKFGDAVRVIDELPSSYAISPQQEEFIKQRFPSFNNILIVAGQSEHDAELHGAVTRVSQIHHVPVIGDIISNMHGLEDIIRHPDSFLGQASDDIKKMLRPDLLITFGKSVISKNLKLFLRRYRPAEHWHIQSNDVAADTYQSTTHTLHASPPSVLRFIADLEPRKAFENQKQNNFFKLWEVEERRSVRTMNEFFPQKDLGEMEIVREIILNLPENCNLHLANSMSVRYANYIGLGTRQKGVKVYANRGTSGIDGCTSTAVGHCLENSTPNVLITGDLAFFYDRNAFWHNYSLPNLRVVLLNNHGGIIFGMIDGPGSLPESEEYFITRQKLNASKLCEEFGFDYLKLDNKRKVKNLLKDFFEFDGRTKILEIESDTGLNRNIFENLKTKIKNSYEL